MANPLSKLSGIGNGGWQEDVMHVIRKKNDGLLPHNTTLWNSQKAVWFVIINATVLAKLLLWLVFKTMLSVAVAPKLPAGLSISVHTCISHVVDFIKDDPRHLPHDFRAPVQHAPQDLKEKHQSDKTLSVAQLRQIYSLLRNTVSHFCCHDETGGSGVDGDVTSHQPHVLEFLIHLPVFLVREGLDGTGEDDSLFLSERQRDGIPVRGGHKHRYRTRPIVWLKRRIRAV